MRWGGRPDCEKETASSQVGERDSSEPVRAENSRAPCTRLHSAGDRLLEGQGPPGVTDGQARPTPQCPAPAFASQRLK